MWDDKAKAVWLNSVMVNPSGVERKWVALDMYNEWCIRTAKEHVRAWTNQMNDEYNRIHLIRQLPLMQKIKRHISESAHATDYGTHSSVTDSKGTVRIFVRDMVAEGIFQRQIRVRCKGKDNSLLREANDLLCNGLSKLMVPDNPIKKFRKSVRCNWKSDATLFSGFSTDEEDDEE